MAMILKKLRDKDNKFDNTDVIFRVESEYLPDVLEAMLRFISACGFTVKPGDELVIVNAEEPSEER